MKRTTINTRSLFPFYIVFFLFLATTTLSCIKEVKIDFEGANKLSVINAMIRDDDSIRVFVGKTGDIFLEGQTLFNTSATVSISEGTVPITTLDHSEQGLYTKTGVDLTAEKSYSIKVTSAGYPEASAIISIPKTSNPIVGPPVLSDEEYNYGSYTAKVTLKVKDTNVGENYYFISPKMLVESNGALFLRSMKTFADDPIFGPANVLPESFLIKDTFFDQKERTFVSEVRLDFNRDETGIAIVYEIGHINKAAFDWYVSSEAQGESGDNPFGTAIPLKSNITNGYGFFGGMAVSESERINVTPATNGF